MQHTALSGSKLSTPVHCVCLGVNGKNECKKKNFKYFMKNCDKREKFDDTYARTTAPTHTQTHTLTHEDDKSTFFILSIHPFDEGIHSTWLFILFANEGVGFLRVFFQIKIHKLEKKCLMHVMVCDAMRRRWRQRWRMTFKYTDVVASHGTSNVRIDVRCCLCGSI